MGRMITRLELGEADTFPKLLRRNYHQYGEKPALRKKRYGIWRSFSWQDYYENVKYFALGLMSLGFERGQNVAILGDNDPEWWYAALAAQSLGGVQYGIYVDCVASEVEYFVQAGRATMVVVKDQEQCDKLLEIKGNLPEVRKVIYWEPKGMWRYDDDFLMEFIEDIIDVSHFHRIRHRIGHLILVDNIGTDQTVRSLDRGRIRDDHLLHTKLLAYSPHVHAGCPSIRK